MANSLPKIVSVTWRDSAGCGHWIELEEPHQTCVLLCHTVGFLIAETEDYLAISHTVAGETDRSGVQVCGDMTIPRESVVEFFEIDLGAG